MDNAQANLDASMDASSTNASTNSEPSIAVEYESPAIPKYWNKIHGPRQVHFNFDVIQIHKIDNINHLFSLTFKLQIMWMISKEENDKITGGAKNTTTQEEWHGWEPCKPEFPNAGIEFETLSTSYDLMRLHDMMMMRRTQICRGDFAETMELQNFPFDAQDLTLNIDFKEPTEICTFQPDYSKEAFVTVSNLADASLSEWIIHHPICRFHFRHDKILGHDMVCKNLKTSRISIMMKAKRCTKTYIFRVFWHLQ